MKKNENGFSLLEVAITLAIVSLIVVSAIGLIGPIQDGVREGSLAGSASRLLDVVEAKLNASDASLDSALGGDSALVVVYQVRVKPDFLFTDDPTSGDLNPELEGGINSGYRLAPVARRSWVADEVGAWPEDSTAIDGPAFLVKVTAGKQDRLQPGQLTEKTPPEIQFLNCDWYELPIGFSKEGWDTILKRTVILKTPLVRRP